MQNIRSNFVYLQGTSLKKYYRDLVRAENVCEKLPDATRFIVRKVMDDLLRNIAEKNSENNILNFNELIDRSKKFLPGNIYEYVNIIKINTDNIDRINIEKNMIRNHVQLLGLIHVILIWYLKNITEEISKSRVISFEAPKTINTEKEELVIMKKEIDDIDYEISKFRNLIISGETDFNKINYIREDIEKLKMHKRHSEPFYNELRNKIYEHEEDLEYVNEDYERAKKKIEELDRDIWGAYGALVNKERMLINIEQENRELGSLVKQLEQKNEQVDWNQKYSKFDLESIRDIYKKVNNLTKQYKKVLEEIKFSYDKMLEKILEKDRAAIRTELNFQDSIFNEKVESYMKNVNGIKSRTKILKEMFYDTTLNNSVHREFARSFFYLDGMQLRVFYTMMSKVDNISVFLNKSKEILSQSKNDVFMDYIRDNAKELDKYSDEEVKLKLYYKLMELSKLPYRDFEDRFEFIKTLDSIVEKAFLILKQKKDFKEDAGSKLESIKAYYLSKMENSKGNEEVITEKNLIGSVYNWSFVFHQNREEELIPLFVMQCLITDKKSYEREYNFEGHEKLIELWSRKQNKYSMIFASKKNAENNLITLLKEKREIEKRLRGFTKANSELGSNYNVYELEFRNIVLKSEKLKFLKLYPKYEEALHKKIESDNMISEAKNKLGIIKSVLSPDMWKSHSEKASIDLSFSNIEKRIIEEAKCSIYFQEEFKEYLNHIEKVEDISQLISSSKEELKEKNNLIEENKNKIKEYQKQLRIIKDEYPDMKNVIQY